MLCNSSIYNQTATYVFFLCNPSVLNKWCSTKILLNIKGRWIQSRTRKRDYILSTFIILLNLIFLNAIKLFLQLRKKHYLKIKYSANILQMKKPVIPKTLESTGFISDLGWIQTSNLLSRNQAFDYMFTTQYYLNSYKTYCL